MTAHFSDNGDQFDYQTDHQVEDITVSPSDNSEWWREPSTESSDQFASDSNPDDEVVPIVSMAPTTASDDATEEGIATGPEDSAEEQDAEAEQNPVPVSQNGQGPFVNSAILDQMANLAVAFADMRDEVSKTVTDLTRGLKEKHRQDDLFSQMHEELQTHRQGIRRALMTPAMLDLVQLYDYFETAADHAEESSQLKKNYELASQKVLETLMRNGVEPHPESTNADVDRKRHQVIGVEETSNPELDKKIARPTSRGFTLDGISLRSANVITWKFVPGQEEKSDTD